MIKFLLVEDDPHYAHLMSLVLEGRGTVQRVETLAEAIAVANGHDAIFLDLGLPDSRGIDTFQAVRQCFPSTPIVIVTGDNDEAVAFRAMKDGAKDYIVKAQDDLNKIERVVVDIVAGLNRAEKFNRAKRSFASCLMNLSPA